MAGKVRWFNRFTTCHYTIDENEPGSVLYVAPFYALM